MNYSSVLNDQPIKIDVSQNKAKVPMLLKGSWHVPGCGVLNVTDEYISKLTTNFKNNVLGFKPYATIGHLKDGKTPHLNTVDGEVKKGDLEEIIQENDVVYGVYSINSESYKMLQSGEYEYSSPEIIDSFPDKVTGQNVGPVLIRTALTNAPFMPFNDNKITMLSSTADSDTSKDFHISIKLSTNIMPETTDSVVKPDSLETELQPPEQTSINPMTTPSISPTTPIASIGTDLNNPAPAPAPAAPQLSLEAIKSLFDTTMKDTLGNVKTQFDAALTTVKESSDASLQEVKSQVEQLTALVSEVAKQKEVVDNNNSFITAMSTSMQKNNLKSKLNVLFDKHNVSPAALQSAEAIIEELKQGKNVIKLSTSDKELDIEDAILELVKLSATAGLPSVEKVGSIVEAPKTSYFSDLVAKNKAKASGQSSK